MINKAEILMRKPFLIHIFRMSEHNYFPKYITRLPRIARLFFEKMGFIQHAAKSPLALTSEPFYTCNTLYETLVVGRMIYE
jgi:hypothetical protein